MLLHMFWGFLEAFVLIPELGFFGSFLKVLKGCLEGCFFLRISAISTEIADAVGSISALLS